MNQAKNIVRLAAAGARQVHSTNNLHLKCGSALRVQYDNSHLPKLRELQAKFQVHNDVPVHLKGGPMDKVLFYFTMGLIVVGLGFGGEFMYQCYFDKKLFGDNE